MKAMPSVSFDQEGRVILRGSDRVIVLIDGKQSSLTGYGNQKGLDDIPAASIERIEIINNPSAKYDANGMAGIINIVYKKEKQTGLHGSVGLAYGLGVLSQRKDDLPTELGSYTYTPKYIPSLDLNFRQNKLNFFLQTEMLFQERLPNNEFTTRFYDDGSAIASQVPENRTQSHYILKGGMDYTFNDRNMLSLSGIYDWESHEDTAQVAYVNQENIRTRFITWNEEEITGYMNYAIRYQHKLNQPGHELQANLQYSRGWEDETYFLKDSSFIREDGRDVTSIIATEHIASATVDYIRPTASGRLELGGKIQIRDLPVEYEQQRGENSMLYDGLGEWSEWDERIHALGNLNLYQIRINEYQGNLLFPYPHTFQIMQTSDNTWDAKIINTFEIRDDLQLQITLLYFADKNIPQGNQLSRSSVDMGIQKTLLKGKADLTLAVTDIFNKFGLRQEIQASQLQSPPSNLTGFPQALSGISGDL